MISYYRAEIAKLQKLNERLRNLKGNLSGSVLPNLNNVVTSLTNAENSLKEAYLVDGETADGKSIEKNRTNIENCCSTITGSVIPSIDNQISINNGKIANYEALIAAELARIEAESKKGNN
jgi:hypothetical protein